MYLEYWGFNKFPFDNVPDPEFFFLSKPHEEGLARLVYAVEMKKGCALLSGNVGCGKTTLSKVFIDRISDADAQFSTAIVSNPCSEPKEFLQDVLYKFQAHPVPDSKVEILQTLNHMLIQHMKEKKETLLIIDEAQLLPEETLEEIRLLLNFQSSDQFLLTVMLLGQPELLDNVKRIKQLDQRIAIRYFLRPFNLKETASYIIYRQQRAGGEKNVFTKEAIIMVHNHTKGSPRSINNLCDLALLLAFGEKKEKISSNTIRNIIDDGAVV